MHMRERHHNLSDKKNKLLILYIWEICLKLLGLVGILT